MTRPTRWILCSQRVFASLRVVQTAEMPPWV